MNKKGCTHFFHENFTQFLSEFSHTGISRVWYFNFKQIKIFGEYHKNKAEIGIFGFFGSFRADPWNKVICKQKTNLRYFQIY
jgi:hypothetical protein